MNTFEDALKKLDKTAELIGEDISFIKQPEKTLITNFPVKLKDQTNYFTGYRVQYNSLLGPTKGGLRFAPSVDLNEVKALALLMTLKNSLAGIPYGGAKGGVTINTKELSVEDLEKVTRGYTRSIANFIGPRKDVPAPDVYTNPQVMSWILDEYEVIKGYHVPGVVTGKPLELGGSAGRGQATAMGAYHLIKKESSNSSVIIQGFGNAGQNLASMLYNDGYQIVGVSDSRSGVYSKQGLNIPELIKHKKVNGRLQGFPLSSDVSNEELITSETNILVPAAVENVIHKDNARLIKARMIFEVANGPVTSEADELLENNGVIVYPDVLCNSGGVIVSYYEWVQNNQGHYWTKEKVNEQLKNKIVHNLELVKTESTSNNITLRQAAYNIALKRLIKAKKLRSK